MRYLGVTKSRLCSAPDALCEVGKARQSRPQDDEELFTQAATFDSKFSELENNDTASKSVKSEPIGSKGWSGPIIQRALLQPNYYGIRSPALVPWKDFQKQRLGTFEPVIP